jgi:hypothetical protein
MGQLGLSIKCFDTSHTFSQKVLAFNVISDNSENQSDYNSKISALVPEFNKIVTWSIGSGKVISKT